MKSTKKPNPKLMKTIWEIDELMAPYNVSMELLRAWTKGKFKFPFYLNAEMMETDVYDLELSVRAYNCLKRANLSTVGMLVEAIETKEELLKYRNMGVTSANEILEKLLIYQFNRLAPERKLRYVRRILELNLVE